MKIFSIHAKRTDFLRLQVESLINFCEDNFDYYCIDNFLSNEQSNFIKNECELLGVNYVKFDNYQISGTAFDHAPALNSIKNIAKDDEIIVILDFDVFMINHFSFERYILDYDISGIYMQRDNFEKEYIAPFVVIVNKNISKIDFNSNNGCDVGGNTQHYIKNKKVKWMKHTSYLNDISDCKCFDIDYNPKYSIQIIESCFVHYFRGTNWDNNSHIFHNEKTDWLKKVLQNSKNNKIINQDYLDKIESIFSFSFYNWNGKDKNPFNSQINPFFNI